MKIIFIITKNTILIIKIKYKIIKNISIKKKYVVSYLLQNYLHNYLY